MVICKCLKWTENSFHYFYMIRSSVKHPVRAQLFLRLWCSLTGGCEWYSMSHPWCGSWEVGVNSWAQHWPSGWPWVEEAACLLPFAKHSESYRWKCYIEGWHDCCVDGCWGNMGCRRISGCNEGGRAGKQWKRQEGVFAPLCCSGTWVRMPGHQSTHALDTRTSEISLLSCWLLLLLSADQMMYFAFEEAVITEEPGSTFLCW